jgi:hypothetical protein
VFGNAGPAPVDTPVAGAAVHTAPDPDERMVRAVRTWLRRAIATTAAFPALPAAVSDVTPTAASFSRNTDFQRAYIRAGATNATFEFPPAANRPWPYSEAQCQALNPDLIATLNG